MKLYSKTICPKCLWVKSELQQNGIEVEEVNIEKNLEAFNKIKGAGILSVPVLDVNGELISDISKILATIPALKK